MTNLQMSWCLIKAWTKINLIWAKLRKSFKDLKERDISPLVDWWHFFFTFYKHYFNFVTHLNSFVNRLDQCGWTHERLGKHFSYILQGLRERRKKPTSAKRRAWEAKAESFMSDWKKHRFFQSACFYCLMMLVIIF